MPRWKNAFQTNDEIYRLKRAAVLREANRIMGRSGFHNTSLDDIAASLQVSKGTLYNYVADKQEILFECHMLALDIGQKAFQFAQANGANGLEKFRLLLRAYVVWMNGVIGGGVMSDVSALRPSDRATIVARRDVSDSQIIGFIEEGMRDGSIRPVIPKMVLFTTMGAVNSIPTWYLPEGPLTPEQIADEMLNLIANAIATSEVGANPPIPSYSSVGGQGFASETPGRGNAIPNETPARSKRGKTPVRPGSAGAERKTRKSDAPPAPANARQPDEAGKKPAGPRARKTKAAAI